jgi:hypothetical protein
MTTGFEPSKRRIATATVLALGGAIVILFVAVLPAEYGIDPLGTGRVLGLTALSGTVESATSAALPVPESGSAAADASGALQQDVYEVELRPFEGVEYKYRLELGASLVYAWNSTAGVAYEFHGEPDGAPAKYFDSYKKDAGIADHGGFTASKPGIHGWFWENKSAARVKVTLRTSGFYAKSTEYRDGERIERRFPAIPPR